MSPLDENTRLLVDGTNFASVSTLGPDGGPQTSIVWIGRDGELVVFSTTKDRQKARNLARDPRVSIAIYERENPYNSVEIRGIAELIDDPDRTWPKRLSQKYLGEDAPPEGPEVMRLAVFVRVHKVKRFSA